MFEIFKPSGKFEIFLLRFLPGFSEGGSEFCPGLGSPKGVPFPGSGNSGNPSEEFSGPRARARRSEISPYVSAARDVCADEVPREISCEVASEMSGEFDKDSGARVPAASCRRSWGLGNSPVISSDMGDSSCSREVPAALSRRVLARPGSAVSLMVGCRRSLGVLELERFAMIRVALLSGGCMAIKI
jgi:hypothetical protein